MNYLEQIFFEGRAIVDGVFEFSDKKLTYKLTNLTYEGQMDIDDILAELPEGTSQLKLTHVYMGEVLSRTLLEFNGTVFKSADECKEFLSNKPAIFIEALGKKQGEFEKELRTMLEGDAVDETFSKTPSTSEESKPGRKE